MKTAILLAVALVATTAIATAPTATADTVVDCALWEGHEPAHCVADCTRPGSVPLLQCAHDDE